MIRWITDRLGTAPATSPELTPDLTILDVRDLVDKHGNGADTVRLKIEEGAELLRAGRRLVVCCDYGISRSNSIAAGVLAVVEGLTLTAAAKRVSDATGERDIKAEPLAAVAKALGDRALGDRSAEAGAAAPLLVTGGSGFLGQAFRRQWSGPALYPSSAEVDLIGGPLMLDLMVKESGARTILHLANPRVYTSNRAMGEMLTMLRNVLDVCRSNGARLIFMSGWEVYSGYRSADITADETLPLRAKGPYGEAKMLCELLVEQHRQHYGLNANILRPTPVFGPGSDRPKFIYNFLRKAEAGQKIVFHAYRNGFPKLELMHVDDLTRCIAALAASSAPGDFNVGGGALISTREVAEIARDVAGSNSDIEHRGIEDDIGNVRMDMARANAVLGWTPQIDAKAALRTICEQFVKGEL